ncbi:MAG: hypothetical protein JST75_15630 [Bacteroidetes bacterium]|nr:hypothetical protein [Bacteroidota bacterium]
MNKAALCLLLFFCHHSFAQSAPDCKEAFVNKIIRQVVDSSISKYYLLKDADPCLFKKFDYSELLKYSLDKVIPISALNELAKNCTEDNCAETWVQEKLDSAICIDQVEANAILNPKINTELLTKKEKKKALKQLEKDLRQKTVYEKSYFIFSKPVFTDDHDYAVMNVVFECGNLCATAWTYLFKKHDDSWEIAGKIFGWQS